jgi:hypothetical protein
MPRMTVEEWQKRLADNFSENGIIGGNLLPIAQTEDEVGAHYVINTFKGHDVLANAFMGFFAHTLRVARLSIGKLGWPTAKPNYPIVLAYFLHLFRRCRAAEILSLKGYPLDGYALMRDIKDRAIALGAMGHNVTTILRVLGTLEQPVPKDEAEYRKKSVRKRKDEENKIWRRMVGTESGLPPDIQETLKRWDEFFHLEVHGGIYSLMQEISGFETGTGSFIGPTHSQDAYVMYINRASEINWLITRLLPYLQPSMNVFGDGWDRKRTILDESFRYMAEDMSSLGKHIGEAFITLIDSKFSFGSSFCYFEADGSA